MFFDVVRQIAGVLVTVFVVSSLLNVGLTQKPSRIREHLGQYRFLARMVLANLLLVPAVMVLATVIVKLEPVYAAALIVFGFSAGAPFLIALVRASQNDIAAAATVMTVLIVGTIIVLPVALPLVLEGVSVNAGALVVSLLMQMLAPMVVGMLVRQYLVRVAAAVQPWVARVSSIALYGVLGTIIVGYLPDMLDPELWKAIATGLVVVVIALVIGYLVSGDRRATRQLGALATAQRNTAAALIVVSTNFDSRAIVVVTLVNTLALFILMGAAKAMSRRATVNFLPIGADVPTSQPESA